MKLSPEALAQADHDLRMARNYGGTIESALRDMVLGYLREPTADRWDDIFTIVVGRDPMVRLRDAVCAVDPSFCNAAERLYRPDGRGGVRMLRDWSRIPSPEIVVQALAWAAR